MLSGFGLIDAASRASGWWGDVLGCLCDEKGRWFECSLARQVGDGHTTSFWKDIWVGEGPLCRRFPRLFDLSVDKDCSVAEAGEWVENVWRWGRGWRRQLRGWEVSTLDDLIVMLECRKSIQQEPDRWRWKLESSGSYSVRSSYKSLEERKSLSGSGDLNCSKQIWNNWAIPKVRAIVWRILHRRIATKKELSRRGGLPPNASLSCALCNGADETVDHLFVECRRTWELWACCMDWIGLRGPLSGNVSENFIQFCSMVRGRKNKMLLASIWECVAWSIWKKRNEIVFNNGTWHIDRMMGEIKSVVWSWVSGKEVQNPQRLSFRKWCRSPLCKLS